MAQSLVDDPRWWAVLDGGGDGLWVDPVLSARTDSDHGIVLTYRSGYEIRAALTRPTANSLRLRIAEASVPALSDEALPMTLQDRGDGSVAIRTPEEQLLGVLGSGGLHTASISRPGAVSFEVGNDEALPIIDTAVGTGRLMRHDQQLGWIEAIALPPDVAVYGGGESFRGLNLRMMRRRLVNCETHTASGRDVAYLNVPWFWSPSGWSVLVNTGGMVGIDVGASQRETLVLVVDGPSLDFVTTTGSPTELMTSHWAMTGVPGEVPDWAFGVWLSRATYVNEEEINQVLDELDAAQATPDVIHVDAWLDGNVFAEFTCHWRPDRDRFAAGWTARLRSRGVRSSVWLNPFVLAGERTAEHLRAQGWLLRWPDGNPAHTNDRHNRWLIDFTNPDACRWWRDRVERLFAEESPDAVKLDFAEEVPSHAVCHDGRHGSQIRNLYARLYQAETLSAITTLRQRGVLTEPVPMFCRSGTHGSQRNPCHWVGDSPATWDGLVSALYAVQSLSASGFGLVAHDAGGFISPGTGDIPTRRLNGEQVEFFADVDPELYVRWVQWAALSPMMRLHGLGLREPTAYPSPYREAAIEAFALRRRLATQLPGLYRQSLEDGLPLLRPMPLAIPDDRAARDADLQYFLGPDILVAPLLQAGGIRQLYVPTGRWQNLFDGTELLGPGWQTVRVGLASFPAYRRRMP